MSSRTLIELLQQRKDLEDKGVTFIRKAGQEEFLSYKALYRQALKGLSYLQNSGMQEGDELVLQVEDNRTFLVTFWACLLGKLIPVPLTVGKTDDHKNKVFHVWRVLHRPSLIATPERLDRIVSFGKHHGWQEESVSLASRGLNEQELLAAVDDGVEAMEVKATDIAFIQFSSGSTGQPKGVVLTHRNLLVNIAAISKASNYRSDDSMLSWMPLTHDMGLIGFHLNPLAESMNQFWIPTSDFIRHPSIWLSKASEHKISILCSPNFGYRYLLKHADLSTARWDLSAVRILYNGAEPVSVALCQDFIQQISVFGLKPMAMRPVYGLAEASLAVTIPAMDEAIVSLALDRRRLGIGDNLSLADETDMPLVLAGVGRVIDQCQLRITDETGSSLADNYNGYIEISGENVTQGYYQNPDATAESTTPDGWFRTGDIGFLSNGMLYVTGRAKDVFFVNGQNFYPHDIERIAEQAGGIELNKVAAGGFFNADRQKDETVLFVFHRDKAEHFPPIARRLKELILLHAGLEIDRVVAVKDIPRTTSGKLQRFKLIEQYRQGAFTTAEEIQLSDAAAATESLSLEDTPGDETSALMAEIWKNILRLSYIKADMDFFAAGGTSLRAAELSMAIQQQWNVELTPDDIYKTRILSDLSALVKSRRLESCDQPLQTHEPIAPAAKADWYPLASAQRRLFYGWQLDPDSLAYNVPVAFRVNGAMDIQRLETGFRQLILRHDALRMVFRAIPEPSFQVKDDGLPFHLDRLTAAESELANLLREQVRPFDLATGPLFRLALITVGDKEQILFADFHHIIADGLSVYRLLGEWQDLYAGRPLPALTLQFKDFPVWERNRLLSDKLDGQRKYWKEEFSGEWPMMELPFDLRRPSVFQSKGKRFFVSLPPDITRRLSSTASTNDCSLHVLLLTAYLFWLSKHSGSNTVTTGIPVAGRRHPDWIGVMGMFVNNLPLRIVIDPQDSFKQLLQTVRRQVNAGLDHQDLAFEEMITILGQKREMSRNPLFDNMFIYQNMGMPAGREGDWDMTRHFFDPGCSKFDLSLEVTESIAHIDLAFEYAVSLFREETISRMANHFIQLLHHVPDLLNEPLTSWKVHDAAEENRLRQFNATAAPYREEATIPALIHEQVRRTPSAAAILHGDRWLSYSQLEKQSDNAARQLQEWGVKTGDVVGLLLPRSIDCVIAILGILKAGACFLPIEPAWPADRVSKLVSASRCRLVLTDDNAAVRIFPGSAVSVTFAALASAASIGWSNPAVDKTGFVPPRPDDLAYVLYTSGSTGEPKGVMIGHRSLANYISWAASSYCQGRSADFPFYTSYAFDLTITSLFTPLVTGGKIVVYEDDDRQPLIEKVLSDDKADVLKLTPAHLGLLAGSDKMLSKNNRLHTLIVGGDRLDSGLARQITDRFRRSVLLYNEYGPTEATVGCMLHLFNPASEGPSVPIGIPAANTQIYLLDTYGQPVLPGVNGEIYIAGHGLARGYLHNEELTRSRFVSNPFYPGTRMYKTGDMGRFLADGTVDYRGRIDRQVKINGHRLELAEIEIALEMHPAIKTAVVTAWPDPTGQLRLMAYYTDRIAGESPDPANLRSYSGSRLPHYMIPARFIRLEAVPLTRNGKIDYAALPDPVMNTAPPTPTTSSGGMEEKCVDIWKEALGVEMIGPDDNFFEWGGDSIKAFQIAARLSNIGITVYARDILFHQTIAVLLKHIGKGPGQPAAEQGIVRGERGPLPIESWFLRHRFAHPGSYNHTITLSLKKNISLPVLKAALTALVHHHDGLRINVDEKNGRLFYNERHLQHEFPLKFIPGFINEISDFDLQQDLLIKACLITGPGGQQLLRITAHHLVVDSLSWRILLEDLQTAALQLLEGSPVRLPAKTASAGHWQKALQHWTADSAPKERMGWEKLDQAGFELPLDTVAADWTEKNHRTMDGSLGGSSLPGLPDLYSRKKGIDLPAMLVTALAQTLQEWTGEDRFVIELENHGRLLDEPDTARTVGWFTALYPVSIELDGNDAREQLISVDRQLKNIPGQGLGYGLYQQAKEGSAAIDGLPSVLRFNYLGGFDKEVDNDLFALSDQSLRVESHPQNNMTAIQEWNLMLRGGDLYLSIGYNQSAHKVLTISWLKETFFQRVTALCRLQATNPDEYNSLKEIGLSEEEWELLLK